jgi:hypothetical protein
VSAKDDIKEFYDDSPHRGPGIALPTILENRVTEMLKFAMRRDAAIEKELFRGSGALGDFGVKIQLAYMLGLIAKETYSDLDILRRIRNDFAHNVKIKSFDDESISNRIKSMHVYKILIDLRNRRPFDPRRAEPFNEKLRAQILRDEMDTMRDSFRMCVRLLIHHLNNLEEALRRPPDTVDPRGPKGTKG